MLSKSPPSKTKSTATRSKTASRSTRTKTTPAKNTRSSGQRPTAKPRQSRGKSTTSKRWQWKNLSTERKLDIAGIILALVGLLTLLSLISAERSTLTGGWVNFLNQIAGWGTIFLPIALLLIGVWLVLRNLDQLPTLSAARLTGLILLYCNILTWMHILGGKGWELAQLGKGGGYIGGFFEWALTSSVGTAGSFVFLVAWLIIALGFTFDISITELFNRLKKPFIGMAAVIKKEPETTHKPGNLPLFENKSLQGSPDLPTDYNPLPQSTSVRVFSPKKRQSETATSVTELSQSGLETGTDSTALKSDTTSASAQNQAWLLPQIADILDPATPAAAETNIDKERAILIEETLASFGAPVHVVEINRGPTVTQFGVEPDFIENRAGRMRVRVSKITALADDLTLALAAPRIRIQAPVPGRNYVGIEVPNPEISRVALREILESDAYKRKRIPLKIALGKDVAGAPKVTDLGGLPHLLIAGTTGSGKSVCVNAILAALLVNNTPADLRLVLVDPKRVELTGYNGIPHLLAPVITDTDRVVNALQWMQREMDARYHRFSQIGVRNLEEYNKSQADHLPYIVVVIDELADLMMLAPDETERAITRLAQLARATGIHLILATQRPSVDVVTGLIKANFPARIAFAVASGVDSRVILDQPGAERLLGRGDMLFQAPDARAPVRLQGVYVSDHEIARLVDYWRLAAMNISQTKPQNLAEGAVDSFPVGIPLKQGALFDDDEDRDADPMLAEATELVRREGRASITMLQRRLRIGYTRAARMIDALEDKGIISPTLPNSQVREVLDYGQTAPPEDDGY
jgi:S-DNA-T family DNA segregation ATPase FtsK/SpoIIIE